MLTDPSQRVFSSRKRRLGQTSNADSSTKPRSTPALRFTPASRIQNKAAALAQNKTVALAQDPLSTQEQSIAVTQTTCAVTVVVLNGD